MKGDVVLDFVLFQLTAPRTRCELFVSADGMKEKLASGFLKPFMNHLRAVEEQVAGGCECIKLECPQIYHGRAWFTKGTVERFVRFVSTPEVLERVKSIEDELVQLEQVRSIQASGLAQADDPFLGADPVYLRKGVFLFDVSIQPFLTDGKALPGPVGKSCGSKVLKRYPYDPVESTEASKVELLRAMDVRMLALSQEQSTAFGRATAAGFNSENMTDLMAFSEYFGADRLGAACVNFLSVLERRGAEPMKHLQAMSSGGDISLPNPNGLSITEGSHQGSALLSHHKTDDAKHQSDDATILMVKDGPLLSSKLETTEFDRFSYNSKGPGVTEARKRWGPPANIRSQLFGNETQTDYDSTFSDMEPPHIKGKSETGISKTESTIINDPADRPIHSLADPGQVTTAVSKNTSAPKVDEQSNSQVLNGINEENNGVVCRPKSGRRLSVQDAINMFENKKEKQLVKVPGKLQLAKQDTSRLSTERSRASQSGSVVSRSSSASADGNELGSSVQGSQASGTGEFVLPRKALLAVGPQGPASDSAIFHGSPTAKEDHFPSKVSGTKEENLSATFGKTMGRNFPDPVCLSLESKLQGMLARDVPAKQGPSKRESNVHMSRSASFVNRDQNPLAKPDMMGSRNSEVAGNDHGPRESIDSLRVDFFQHEKQNLASMDSNQASADDDNLREHRGRLYEHYQKLRDAKLMEENDARRAQREAKLKSLNETLLLRKAELDAQQQSKTDYHQARAAKLQARKANFYTLQRKEDVGDDRYGDVSINFDDGSISPSFAPAVVKEQASTSKSQSGRKHAAGSTKGTTPRSSNRGTSVSPKLTPRSPLGSATKPRKSVAANVNENALAKSAPSFAILRKENTRPSSGRPLIDVNLQAKDGGSGCIRAVNDAHTREANMNALVCTSPGNGFLMVSAPLLAQRGVGSETTALCETTHSNGYIFCQEAEPIAINGSSSGQHLLGMTQQLPSRKAVATYESNEERGPIITYHRTHDNTKTLEDSQDVKSQSDTFEEEDMDDNVMEEAHSDSTNSAAFQMMGTTDASGDKEPQFLAIDGNAATLKDDVEGNQEQLGRYVANASTSFRVSSLPRERHVPAFLRGSASPPNSRVVQAGVVSAGHFGTSVDRCVKPSLESPVNWKLFASETGVGRSDKKWAASETGVGRSNKKWAGTQKLAAMAVPTNKEPAKGFKRLLKFARKNRAVDATVSDWVSTSEGDDEFEDQRFSVDDLRGRIIPDMNGENPATPEKVTPAQSVRSSIPSPPTNFRLRDDHLMGTTMLKAPKSFFSLSSFRNKGIEGKAR